MPGSTLTILLLLAFVVGAITATALVAMYVLKTLRF
jgi:hypothetical protein